MSAWTSPKGPLPSRVYWFRRLVLLAVVFVLVFGTARLLGGGESGTDADAQATRTAAEVEPDAAAEATGEQAGEQAGEAGPTPEASPEPTPEPTPEPPPLPEPSGPCENSDVVVTPVVGDPRADGKVDMVLALRTQSTPACTWQVSADTVTIKISSGSDDYWFSSHCPRAVPNQEVVLYQGADTTVPFVWSGKRSDPECSRLTAWAYPGYYHVKAAAFEGEPSEVQFRRTAASITATRTAEPEPQKKNKKKNNKNKQRNQQGTPQPSGAVEPTPTP